MKAKSKTVLYVEDNPANLDLVVRFLAQYPEIEVVSAMSAEDGMDILNQQLPDLILLDINLPGMDGYQMLEQIKQIDQAKHIPVVALTANVMMQDIEEGFSSGFDDYLTKPIDMKIFRSTVLDQLGILEDG